MTARIAALHDRRIERAAAGLPRPEVEEVATNFGPSFDAIVTRAKRNQLPVGVDADYDLVRDNFDYDYYLLQTRGLHDKPDVDPIRDFLAKGAEATAHPIPGFSTRSYVSRNPAAAATERSPYLAWLKRGRPAGEIADPSPRIEAMAEVLGRSPEEVARLLTERRTDMFERVRSGKLGEMFAKAVELEPLIGATWSQIPRAKLLPVGDPRVGKMVHVVYRCQEAADFRRARVVIVVNRPRWGSARRIEGHIAHALAASIDPSEIVIIYTDSGGETPEGRFPDGVREVDFVGVARPLTPDEAAQTLVALLRSFHADAIININSRVFYDALAPYGRALAASERVFLTFFNNEQTASGVWDGWSLRHFYRHLDYVAGVITDSQHLKDWLADHYQLDQTEIDRIHVSRAPVDAGIQAVAPASTPGVRPQVFWSGRFDRQKRVDLAIEVARRMPDVDFRLWGEAVLEGAPLGALPANVRLEGRYERFSDLDVSQASAWLYTSAWDGVPSLLLEVAMTGTPIVGSAVGGAPEVLDDSGSWPIADIDDAAAYEKALREILADPAAARTRAAGLRERLLVDRSETDYRTQITELLLVPSAERTAEPTAAPTDDAQEA